MSSQGISGIGVGPILSKQAGVEYCRLPARLLLKAARGQSHEGEERSLGLALQPYPHTYIDTHEHMNYLARLCELYSEECLN